jgi:hypothetical protein
MSDSSSLLSALRSNAVFSGFSALMLVIGAPWIAVQLGLGSTLAVYVTAGVLALFAMQLAHIVQTRQIRTMEIIGIIGSDMAWVVGSGVFVAIFYESITMAGFFLVDVVAAIVLFFAVLQMRGLRALQAVDAA